MMNKLLLTGLAGACGTLVRYWMSGWFARRVGETFPVGTLAVNVTGCFLIGFLFYVMYERFLTGDTLRTVLFIGFLGGFTTFSSFGLQTFTLVRDGEFGLAALNVGVSNFAGLLMVWAGYTLAKVL
jgi:CrcB protein